jgi:hypothetical protein
MEHQEIDLADFVSVCVFLAEECGKIIRRVQLSGDLQATDKSGDAGPVTLADLTA